MTKDVLVTITGLMTSPQDDDSIEVTTAGSYYFKNGKHYILFEEIGDDMASIVKNMITINGNHVDVTKKGAIDTQMSFEKGCKLNSFYGSAFGQLELGIITDEIEICQDESRLEMNLKYQLEINNAHVSDNKLHMLVQSRMPQA
ncbi:MAG: DUF1934 domain-containing protein [Lachnospiraceae bacterium]|nr:DUF1934 domain-containing protein [Lachnospiraceae bacterium]